MTDSNAKEIRTGRLIAISSLVFCILLIIHHFIVLDESTAKSILSLAGQKTSDTAVKNILNSDRYTGIMYILAYLAGTVASGIAIHIYGGLCLPYIFLMHYLHS